MKKTISLLISLGLILTMLSLVTTTAGAVPQTEILRDALQSFESFANTSSMSGSFQEADKGGFPFNTTYMELSADGGIQSSKGAKIIGGGGSFGWYIVGVVGETPVDGYTGGGGTAGNDPTGISVWVNNEGAKTYMGVSIYQKFERGYDTFVEIPGNYKGYINIPFSGMVSGNGSLANETDLWNLTYINFSFGDVKPGEWTGLTAFYIDEIGFYLESQRTPDGPSEKDCRIDAVYDFEGYNNTASMTLEYGCKDGNNFGLSEISIDYARGANGTNALKLKSNKSPNGYLILGDKTGNPVSVPAVSDGYGALGNDPTGFCFWVDNTGGEFAVELSLCPKYSCNYLGETIGVYSNKALIPADYKGYYYVPFSAFETSSGYVASDDDLYELSYIDFIFDTEWANKLAGIEYLFLDNIGFYTEARPKLELTETALVTMGDLYAVCSPGMTAAQFKEQFKDSQSISLSSGFLKTGAVVSLVKNGADTDNRVVVVLGDCSGDGAVSGCDLIAVKKHLLGLELLENAFEAAANVKKSGEISLNDLVLIKRYVVGAGTL